MTVPLKRWGKPILFLLGLGPLSWLLWQGMREQLGANPVEHVIHFTGQWTMNLLLLTLSLSPLRRITQSPEWLRYRRLFGLYAFFYATVHCLSYAGLDQWFVWASIVHDISKHPYILVGFLAYVMLCPLAATSNRWSIQRLKQRWKTLHRLVYLIPLLGILHDAWLVKKDLSQPLLYAAILFLLLLFRWPAGLGKFRSAASGYRSARKVLQSPQKLPVKG